MKSQKIPVTVLTGFLGSGKTTLLNRILTENHGKRIAVIENEFGEIGIDQALVINADEEIFEMNNGCICCTVRGDLIRILGNLMKRRDKFDHVLVETTGLADPGPVAQTFFVDDEMREMFELDSIITMIDAKHVLMHIEQSNECKEQVAFGDVIILNKTDLVGETELAELERRIRSMNSLARILRATNAAVPISSVFDIGAFDLNRVLENKPTFLELEYPFEWGGIYELDEGPVRMHLSEGPDATMDFVLAPVSLPPIDSAFSAQHLEPFAQRWGRADRLLSPGEVAAPSVEQCQLQLGSSGDKAFDLRIPSRGTYILLTQHLPSEFDLRLTDAAGQTVAPVNCQTFVPNHAHDSSVTSVGLRLDGALSEEKLNAWLGALLREKGVDIFRMKGIFNIHNKDTRYVLQGVHMLIDGREDTPWGDRPRASELVFIGRNLDRAALTKGFQSCRA